LAGVLLPFECFGSVTCSVPLSQSRQPPRACQRRASAAPRAPRRARAASAAPRARSQRAQRLLS